MNKKFALGLLLLLVLSALATFAYVNYEHVHQTLKPLYDRVIFLGEQGLPRSDVNMLDNKINNLKPTLGSVPIFFWFTLTERR
jgi:hypothetical protein